METGISGVLRNLFDPAGLDSRRGGSFGMYGVREVTSGIGMSGVNLNYDSARSIKGDAVQSMAVGKLLDKGTKPDA